MIPHLTNHHVVSAWDKRPCHLYVVASRCSCAKWPCLAKTCVPSPWRPSAAAIVLPQRPFQAAMVSFSNGMMTATESIFLTLSNGSLDCSKWAYLDRNNLIFAISAIVRHQPWHEASFPTSVTFENRPSTDSITSFANCKGSLRITVPTPLAEDQRLTVSPCRNPITKSSKTLRRTCVLSPGDRLIEKFCCPTHKLL